MTPFLTFRDTNFASSYDHTVNMAHVIDVRTWEKDGVQQMQIAVAELQAVSERPEDGLEHIVWSVHPDDIIKVHEQLARYDHHVQFTRAVT